MYRFPFVLFSMVILFLLWVLYERSMLEFMPNILLKMATTIYNTFAHKRLQYASFFVLASLGFPRFLLVSINVEAHTAYFIE